MTIDTAIRWWVITAIVIAAPAVGSLMENLSALSPAEALAANCELPMLTTAMLPKTPYLTEIGFAVAAASLLALVVSFRFAASEVGRYRATTIVSLFTFTAVLVGTLQVFLALFVLPIAKCGA